MADAFDPAYPLGTMRYQVCICLLAAAPFAFGASGGCKKSSESHEREADEAVDESVESESEESEPEVPKAPADAERSPSGLVSKVLRPGQGERRPALYDSVRVKYTAWNSAEEEEEEEEEGEFPRHAGPTTFAVTGVISGWTEALQQMRVGEQRRLWVPDKLAYPRRPGAEHQPLVFDLELLAIIEGEPPDPTPKDVAAPPDDATKTASGLAYKVLSKGGSDDKPNPWDRVTLRYTGWTPDGTMVERSSRKQGDVVDVDRQIPGLQEVLPLLSVGDHARAWIPDKLAYAGRVGRPAGSLMFDIVLLAIERRPAPPKPPAELSAPPPGATRTKSGLAYRIVEHGSGTTKPAATDRVQVHYSAWKPDGTLFDSSVVKGKPITVPLSRLIAGWAEGLQHMVEGDRALLWIPAQLAYGDTNRGASGAPKGPLVYEVELIKVVH